MAKNISTGIDIGTSNVRVVISEYKNNDNTPTVLGIGIAESRGLRHGYIVNKAEAAESIKYALNLAQKEAGLKVRKVFIAIGGISLESTVSQGAVFVSRGDNEVTDADIQKAIDVAEDNISIQSANKEIVQAVPVGFILDGEEVLGKPTGMKGSRLEVKTLFIMCLNQHLKDFIETTEMAGVVVEDIMPSPIAASFVTLTKRQKTAGCILANIGAETLSIVVFENNIPISLKVFPIGGVEITNDIALGLKIPIDEAEDIKTGSGISPYPKKKLEDIIEARLSDIFELIESHLKKIGKNGLLPAGIIITGGTSSIPIAEELAKTSLRLPSKIALPDIIKTTGGEINDSSWSVAYGLCIMGFGGIDEDSIGIKLAKKTKLNIISWIKQFLP